MGRQSARIVFNEKDHKEIYFNGHYHKQMFKGDQLMWEKLAEEFDGFRFKVKPSSTCNLQIRGQIDVDWGDGSSNSYDALARLTSINHEYATNDEYIVKITGNLTDIRFNGRNSYLLQVLDKFPKTMGNVTTAQNFSNCNMLTSVPAGLFENCPNITSFYRCFYYCIALTSIPAGLFAGCSKATNFNGCFQNCTALTNVPAGLFDDCSNVTIFSYCFDGCTALTSIPTKLFGAKAIAFDYCFRKCTSLKFIPTGLFDNCINATNFSYCFDTCSAITSIPEGLFDNCSKANNFSYCFRGCTQLISVPGALFNNCPNVIRFISCFSGDGSITSAVPSLWTRTNVTYYAYCFYGCTNAANYEFIPYSWGGPIENS